MIFMVNGTMITNMPSETPLLIPFSVDTLLILDKAKDVRKADAYAVKSIRQRLNMPWL